MKKVILNIRNEPDNQTYLFQDMNQLVLRNIYFDSNGLPKTRSIPLKAKELIYLAEFIKNPAFLKIIEESEIE